MTYKIYTCASRTLDESLVNAHKKVIKHFSADINTYGRDFGTTSTNFKRFDKWM